MFLASLPTYRAKDEGTRGGFCKQIFDTAKLSEESLDAAAWTLLLHIPGLDPVYRKQD